MRISCVSERPKCSRMLSALRSGLQQHACKRPKLSCGTLRIDRSGMQLRQADPGQSSPVPRRLWAKLGSLANVIRGLLPGLNKLTLSVILWCRTAGRKAHTYGACVWQRHLCIGIRVVRSPELKTSARYLYMETPLLTSLRQAGKTPSTPPCSARCPRTWSGTCMVAQTRCSADRNINSLLRLSRQHKGRVKAQTSDRCR